MAARIANTPSPGNTTSSRAVRPDEAFPLPHLPHPGSESAQHELTPSHDELQILFSEAETTAALGGITEEDVVDAVHLARKALAR